MSNNALEIRGLRMEYPNGLVALKGIDLTVKEGDFFALLGHNGAGKSTTINIISSILKKPEGTIKIFGHDLDKERVTCKKLFGVVSQESNLPYGIPLLEILITQGGLYGIPPHEAKIRALYWLEKMDLLSKANAISFELSGGMIRRFMIAKALMHNPRLLILDEPTTGVDVSLRREMWNFLREINQLGITVILTTHYLEEAEYLCRNIAIIQNGEIKVNTSMKELLLTLDDEAYTLDVSGYDGSPLELDNVKFTTIDEGTLEVVIPKTISISKVFNYLEEKGVVINSLRNSQNRLERIFMEFEDQDSTYAKKVA